MYDDLANSMEYIYELDDSKGLEKLRQSLLESKSYCDAAINSPIREDSESNLMRQDETMRSQKSIRHHRTSAFHPYQDLRQMICSKVDLFFKSFQLKFLDQRLAMNLRGWY